MDGQLSDKVIADLGEVKGLLRGVTDMIRQSHDSTNQRIDDLTQSINRRMDDHDARLRKVAEKADAAMELATDTSARVGKNSLLLGGGAGVLVTAAIELIKAKLMH